MAEQEIGRIKKTDSTEIIIKLNEYKGEKGVDIREYITTPKYTGYTKSGTRIPMEKLKDFKELVNKVE